MKNKLPGWFEADQVFEQDGGWYFGSRFALHLGPYRDYETAHAKSLKTVQRMLELESESKRLSYVRALLYEEWEEVGPFGEAVGLGEEIELTAPPVQVRHGEPYQSWFRSDRFFQMNGVWFFSTREGIDVGPFDSEVEAKKHERKLVMALTQARAPEDARRTIYEYKHHAHVDMIDERRIETVGLREFSRLN